MHSVIMFDCKRSEMSEIIYDNVIRSESEMDRGERIEMMVDIYESSDSVRNQELMINTETHQPLQHPGSVSVKNRRHRAVQVCLCLLCVLLLTAVIVICVYFTTERNQLQTHIYNLTKEREKLLTQHNEILNQSKILQDRKKELQRGLYEQDQRSDNFKWIYYNFSLYYISSEYKSWSDSRRDCKQRDAGLVIINSPEEQKFLQNALAALKHYRIGLRKRMVCKWVNDTLTTGYWTDRYPSSENHYCAVMTSTGWTDDSCNLYRKYICEKRILK